MGVTDRLHPGPRGTPGPGGSAEASGGGGGPGVLGVGTEPVSWCGQRQRRLSVRRNEGPGLWGMGPGTLASGWLPGVGPWKDVGATPGAWGARRALDPGAHPARGLFCPVLLPSAGGRG